MSSPVFVTHSYYYFIYFFLPKTSPQVGLLPIPFSLSLTLCPSVSWLPLEADFANLEKHFGMVLSPVIYVWHLDQLFNDLTQVYEYVYVCTSQVLVRFGQVLSLAAHVWCLLLHSQRKKSFILLLDFDFDATLFTPCGEDVSLPQPLTQP